MSGFFDRFLNRNKEQRSAKSAKERLQFVLIHDRINLPPERLQKMKEEILAVISKYVDVAAEDVDIALEQRERNRNMLIAEIPFSKSRKMEDSAEAAADSTTAHTTDNQHDTSAESPEDEAASDDEATDKPASQ